MEDTSFQSPEDDGTVVDTSISNPSPRSTVSSTTASTSRWPKRDLIDTGELLAVEQDNMKASILEKDMDVRPASYDVCDLVTLNFSTPNSVNVAESGHGRNYDCTLRIEIVSDCDTLDSLYDFVRPWNLMKVDAVKNCSEVAIAVGAEKQIVDCNQTVIEDGLGHGYEYNGAVGRTEKTISEVAVPVSTEKQIVDCNQAVIEDGFGHNNEYKGAAGRTEETISEVAVPVSMVDQIVYHYQADIEDGFGRENEHKGAVEKTEETISACNDSNSRIKCPRVLEVKTMPICSPLLQAKSPYFSKLFSNGMKEATQLNVTLRIHPSEKAAFMELLEYMHSDTLRVIDAPALLDVLLIADKFDVTQCMSHCCHMLLKLPMTYESSLLYLGLPSSLLMAEVVQPLIVAAKQSLAVSFRDISKITDGIMKLPLVGLEAVFESDELQVASEDVLYDLILEWARIHYPGIDERKEIITIRLSSLLRFPFMSFRKLDEVLGCPDMDPVLAAEVVIEALRFKAKASFRQGRLAAKGTNHNRFVQRRYKYQSVKIIVYDFPMQKCEVYMDLKRKVCEELSISGRVDSEIIHFGGQGFFLSAHCSLDRQSSYPCFGLFLGKVERGSTTTSIKYEFSTMINFTEEYGSEHKGYCNLPGGKAVGYRNFFGLHWRDFISGDDLFFINDVLHIKCVLTIQ